MVGPQTGIEGIHSSIHEAFGNVPINLPPANQVSNGIYLDAHAEVGRGIALSFGRSGPSWRCARVSRRLRGPVST
jgi:hypothetical protein